MIKHNWLSSKLGGLAIAMIELQVSLASKGSQIQPNLDHLAVLTELVYRA